MSQVGPGQVGMRAVTLEQVRGGDALANAQAMERTLGGKSGPLMHFVTLNAAAALLAADEVPTFAEGISRAAECIDDGRARRKLERLIEVSQRLGAGR